MSIDGVITEYFGVPLSKEDLARFPYAVGACAGQQVWESLCVTIALKLWRDAWIGVRSSLRVRGDNVAMLTLVSDFRGRCPH